MLGLKFSDPAGNSVAQVKTVDRELTVGRAADVDISLPFKAISRYHARFFPYNNGVWVEDLGSSNGVLVAGQRINQATQVTPGVTVRIGVINVDIQGPPPQLGMAPPQPPTAPVGPPAAPNPPTEPFAPPTDPGSLSPFDPSAYPEPLTRGRPEGTDPVAPSPLGQGGLDDDQPTSPDQQAPPSPPKQPAASVEPEESPEALTMAMPVTPRLLALSGYLKDQVVYLDQPETTVGRVKGSHLVVEDASVSRRHAKIINKDEEFVVFDLRSYNGTYVNDKQITKSDLEHGDTLRFGDIPFQFLLTTDPADANKKKKPKSSRRRRLVILSAATLTLLVAVVAINVLRQGDPPPPPPDPQARHRELQAKIRTQLERGSAQLRQRDWEGASATLQGVLKLDPLNDDAVRGLETARLEREREGWLKEGERIVDTGRDLDRAMVMLTKIPQESTYYPEARVRTRQVKRSIAERSRNHGLNLCRRWRYEECQRELCRFFQTWPAGEPIPDEVRVKRALERAEGRLKRRRDFEPCKIPEPATGDSALDEELAKRYPEEQIRRTVISFYQGRAEDAIHTLSLLEKNRRYRDHREEIGRLLVQMIRVQTASADAHRDVRADRIEEAETGYDAMIKSESKILPTKFKSHYVREVGGLIGDNYHRLGSDHYRSGRLREAYQNWDRGKKLSPNHPELLQALLTLAGRAREICDTGTERMDSGDTAGAVSHFEMCRDITPDTSPQHQLAVQKLAKLGQ